MFRCSLGICCALAALLAGCAHYRPQPLQPEGRLDAFEERSLANPGLRTYLETNLHREFTVWPLKTWDLETLTLAAFYFHPSLDEARAKWGIARAGKITAGQRPNPTFSVSPAYNSTTVTPSPWLVTASIDVPIETAGKRGYRLAQAQHLSETARLGIATIAWEVRTQLRQSLLALWSAEQSGAYLQQQSAAQEEIVKALEAAFAGGAVGQAALIRERINAEQIRLNLVDAQNRQVQSRIRLAETIGLTANALQNTQFSFDFFNQPLAALPPAEARRRALLNRADVLAGISDYAASDAALRLELAKQYPDVHLGPTYEFDQGDHKWGFGLNLELPVLNQNQGPIAEADARRRESAAKFNVLQARVLGEIESALGAYESARKKVAATAVLMEQVEAHQRLAIAQFEAGEVSHQAVMVTRLERATAALSQLDARIKAQEAAAQLESALQTPLELPPALFNLPPAESAARK